MKISIASTLFTASLLAASLASAQSAQPAYTGTFHGAAHSTSGTASVYVAKDGKKTLRLSDFKTSNGPDVHVVLIAASDAQDNENFLDKNVARVELGKLKGNQGNQTTRSPEEQTSPNSKPFRSTANASMQTSARRRLKASRHTQMRGAPIECAPLIHRTNECSAKRKSNVSPVSSLDPDPRRDRAARALVRFPAGKAHHQQKSRRAAACVHCDLKCIASTFTKKSKRRRLVNDCRCPEPKT